MRDLAMPALRERSSAANDRDIHRRSTRIASFPTRTQGRWEEPGNEATYVASKGCAYTSTSIRETARIRTCG